MADQNFTQFTEQAPNTGDYLVGHNQDGTSEIKFQLKDMATGVGFLQNSDSGSFLNGIDSGNLLSKSDSGNFLNTIDSGNFLNTSDSGNFLNTTDSGNFLNTTDSGNFLNTTDSGNFLNTNALLDEDSMSSNSATKTVSQQSVIEYIKSQNVKTITLSWNAAATSATTGTKKAYFRVPESMNGWDLIRVHAEVATAGTTGTEVFDINKNGSSMLSTTLSIDSSETGSDTAATAAVINTAADNISTNDIVSVDVDTIHSGTAAQGEVVTLEFKLP